MPLTPDIAQVMITASQNKARELGVSVATAIVDAEGRLFAFARMLGTHWLSVEAAQAKAFTGALLREDGEKLDRIEPAILAALSAMQDRAILPMRSVTVLREEGRVIAGIGCSGIGSEGASDEDDGECARAARDAYLR
jgi:uncharacterized protein GlcG (DUF336 family)